MERIYPVNHSNLASTSESQATAKTPNDSDLSSLLDIEPLIFDATDNIVNEIEKMVLLAL